MQNLLKRLYSYNWDVDMELVNYTIEQIISEFSYSYANLMKSQSSGSVRLLKDIARERCVKEVIYNKNREKQEGGFNEPVLFFPYLFYL